MPEKWNVLVVDDEDDVHSITKLALKHKRWRGGGFALTTAYSAAEAREILASPRGASFQVALVDVVMETREAGLDLCKYIRAHLPPSLRIVLRTGAAGSAPEEYVLNEYDIDYYLAKAEVTEDRLFSVIRACLRSSQDMSTLLAFGRQLQSFTKALRSVSRVDDLLVLMAEGLKFLQVKYSSSTTFVYDLDDDQHSPSRPDILEAGRTAHARGSLLGAHVGGLVGLPEHEFVIPFVVALDAGARNVRGALHVAMAGTELSTKNIDGFLTDASLFLENWTIAYAALRLQERLAREEMLRDKMYQERTETIANLVTGMAHEINTPLGVAATANSMIVKLMKQLSAASPDSPEAADIGADIAEATGLMSRNIQRAHRLIESFKKLSVGQITDHKMLAEIPMVVQDCVDSMTPVTKKSGLVITIDFAPGIDMTWHGYPGHLSQVVINMIQNVIRYAYPDVTGGKFEISIRTIDDGFRIELKDYGKGVPRELFPQLFQPFVTSGRDRGGTGLGLAISHNIVTNILKGKLWCESTPGQGTTFFIELPRVSPDQAPPV